MNNKIKPALLHHFAGATKRINSIILQAAMLLFLAATVYSCKNGSTPPAVAKSADSLRASYDSLQSQFNATHGQIDDLTSKNAALDSEIMKKDAQIAELDGKISKLRRSNRSLAGKVKADKKLIAELKEELGDKDKSYAEKLDMLQNDRNDLIRQRDSLLAKYNYVKQLGSVLHASDIRLAALHLKHHGTKEKDTHRARKADVLRVSFNIDENRIAEDGMKKLYLVIKDPDGNLLSDPAAGSGATTTSTGSPLNYTMVKEIPLKTNQPVNDIITDWKKTSDYKKGQYSIAIYNEGYKIGGGNVMLD